MQTEKLYYTDCMLRRFRAKVLDCRSGQGGYLVTLDRTAFYPEGGGQACDLGILGDARVLDVREKGEQVVHLCDAPLTPGETVEGTLDWQRRFDLMQQHTGEHIVSGIIHARYGGHNVGFHMGAEAITIDFDVSIPAGELAQLQEEANRAVYADLPVKCWYPDAQALGEVAYRSKRALPWPVRIVEVPGYDTCACCGVHVATTGQIGLIKLLSCVKFHEGVRMELLCGRRALSLLDRVYEQNRLVGQAFSAKLLETGEAARRMNEQLSAEKFRATGLERQLFDKLAEDYVNRGDVLHITSGLEPGAVRELADRIAQRCGGTAAVFSGSDEAGYTLCLVNKQRDIRRLGQAMNAELGGRGGGKAGYFQGSVSATRAQLQAFFLEQRPDWKN